MKRHMLLAALFIALPAFATVTDAQMQKEINQLQAQTKALQQKLRQLQHQMALQQKPRSQVKRPKQVAKRPPPPPSLQKPNPHVPVKPYHESPVTVHVFNSDPESLEFYPTALMADERIVTYLAGTPVVASPFLGSRPAFDGSDYIVNISSINRDVRLMQQRRRLYNAYESLGYGIPTKPILALSGKVEPVASTNNSYFGRTTSDITLGSSELDVAAALNDKVEAYIALAYDQLPSVLGAQRIANSSVFLNMGFINIGDLDQSPFYFTAGQLYVPFGRFSTSMVSAPLTMIVARTRARPFILGYKSQEDAGPFAAVYGFKSDTTLGGSGAGGINLGYIAKWGDESGEIGASLISCIDDANGMQNNASTPYTTFGGFSSLTNGNESVKKIPAIDIHGNITFDRYFLTGEWATSTRPFRAQDLSFNGRGARPQAGQLEGGVTFHAFTKPASFAVGYQWSREALALNIPEQRVSAVFNISIWKDTVESLEYRHDFDYSSASYANGSAPPGVVNANTVGTGKGADTVLAQIGVYF